jgi:asparagine synthase (glutamine-hydrolysing)
VAVTALATDVVPKKWGLEGLIAGAFAPRPGAARARLLELAQIAGLPSSEGTFRGCCGVLTSGKPLAAHDAGLVWAGRPSRDRGLGDPVFLLDLRGSFSFAALQDEGLVLGRGRLGGRPMFYGRDAEGTLIACSRLSPLAQLLGKQGSWDSHRIAELLLDIPGGPATPYNGISRLRSAEVRYFGPHGETQTWLPPLRTDPLPTADPTEIGEELLRLTTCAAIRVVGSAKRVAVSLGGLDSSGLLAALAKARGATDSEVHAITLHFAGLGDDRSYVRDMCAAIGIDPIRVRPADCGRHLRAALVIDGLPSTRPQSCWGIELGRRAHSLGVEVLLDGECGDHLFDGDLSFFSSEALRGHIVRSMASAAGLRGIYWLDSPTRRMSSLVVRPTLKRLFPRIAHLIRRVRQARDSGRACSWAGPRLRQLIETMPAHAGVPRDLSTDGLLLDIRDMSQQWSLESGCRMEQPYLDDDLVEFAERIPKELMFYGGYRRGLFRHAFRDLLPDSVRLREGKSGFGAALAEAFHAAGGTRAFEPYLHMHALAELGFVDPPAFRTAFEVLARKPDDPSNWLELWPAIAIEALCRQQRAAALPPIETR